MTILSVLHQIQGPKFYGYVEDPAYKSWVRSFLRDGVDFVFEEAAGRRPSDAEIVINDPNKYLDIDPTPEERKKLGIPESTAKGWGIDPVHSLDVYESVQVQPLVKREEEWLRRIQGANFNHGLLVCGIAHGLSFGVRLQTSGIIVKQIYNYMPHSLVCPHGPHRMA